jgi:hypothetical protein
VYHLRKQNKIIAIFAGVMLIILQTITVFAESNTNTLSLKLAEYDKESRSVKVYCEMQAKDKVTNGKLRITYDSKQLKLVSSEKGNVLENGMCEINDCLTGNKKEGEIVAAFASAENLPEEGHLLEFSFEVNQSVKEEDSISVELKAEKLANEDADVQVNVENLTFTLKDGTVENPSDDSKKDDKETGNSSTSKTQDNKNKTQTNSSGSSNSSSSSKSGTTSKQNPVKTGDDTKILPFVITGGAALVIIAAGIISKKKQK